MAPNSNFHLLFRAESRCLKPSASSASATASLISKQVTAASAAASSTSGSNSTTSAAASAGSSLTASCIDEPKPLQAPLMSSRDMTSASLEETVINGQVIPCFNIGGEMRLCFPQILKQTLGSFHMEQICLACEELLIHVAPATNQQMSALKSAGVLPVTAHQCGLITKSDAERLAAYLMASKSGGQVNFSNAEAAALRLSAETGPSDSIDDDINDSKVVIFVQHECFGKATGLLYPALYKSPSAKCISCRTCGKIFLRFLINL